MAAKVLSRTVRYRSTQEQAINCSPQDDQQLRLLHKYSSSDNKIFHIYRRTYAELTVCTFLDHIYDDDDDVEYLVLMNASASPGIASWLPPGYYCRCLDPQPSMSRVARTRL